MNKPRSVGRLLATLASVRLAVVTMAALGIACITATFYEARHGTAAAQRAFYGSAWFAGLLVVLGLNVLLSMTKRYPWNRHHIGFVLAHVGILLLLGGSLFSLHAGLDGRMALLEGASTDRIALSDGEALHVELPGQARVEIPVAFPAHDAALAGPERFALAGGSALLVEGFRPHVTVGSSWVEGTRRNPVLHFNLAGEGVQEQAWLVLADPRESHLDFGPVIFGFHEAGSAQELARMRTKPGLHESNHLCILLGPQGDLSFSLASRKGFASGPVAVGRPIPTPWMQLTFTVDRFIEKAAPARIVTRAPLPEGDAPRKPAVKARLEGGRAEWVAWDEPLQMASPGGPAVVSYGPREATLPFRISLLEFRSEKYPGTDRAASYESRVRVEDPERGSWEHLISMNHPLHHRGYTFFQASFVEGERMTSIFSVARQPGLPLVYLGTALLAVGIVWMFYVKPLLARRQGRRMLEARLGGYALPVGEAR